ncbi:MAG TPA: hypothetical protein VLU73_18940, partial [Methylococcaceae bacterium]|nr:hypothetical protein [Methylococcaceae bacterium]
MDDLSRLSVLYFPFSEGTDILASSDEAKQNWHHVYGDSEPLKYQPILAMVRSARRRCQLAAFVN